MLTKIINCRAFADLNKCITLLKVLKSEYRSIQELKTYFSNDIIISMNLEDTLILFEVLGYLFIMEEDSIKKYKATTAIEYSETLIITDIFDLLIKNKLCELSRIDTDYFIQINHEYYAIRNFLLVSETLKKSQLNRFYRINSNYSNYLIKYLKRISKDELLKQLEKENEIGERAEKYVLEYERNRFNFLRDIKHVSPEDNNAGYDIMSYIDDNSVDYDKFIEVKCYSNYANKFYISKNELAQSKKLGKNYFLYLIDSKLNSTPIIIQNPFNTIFSNKELYYEVENISYKISDIEQLKN